MEILLIEDELLIQKSLKRLLERRGARVTAISSGKDAIGLINSRYFDRIICDVMLPDITGLDVIEESKKKYSISEIAQKFIIISAYSLDKIQNFATNYGCRVINKPFNNLENVLDIFLNCEKKCEEINA